MKHRVVYRASVRQRTSPTPFRVDESDGRRWKFSGNSFTTLTFALELYPDAEVSELAQTKQHDLELRPHAFEDRGFDECWHCGHESAWKAHAGGAQ
jgi:hypothetical protein